MSRFLDGPVRLEWALGLTAFAWAYLAQRSYWLSVRVGVPSVSLALLASAPRWWLNAPVTVTGTVRGHALIASPFSHQPCVAWVVYCRAGTELVTASSATASFEWRIEDGTGPSVPLFVRAPTHLSWVPGAKRTVVRDTAEVVALLAQLGQPRDADWVATRTGWVFDEYYCPMDDPMHVVGARVVREPTTDAVALETHASGQVCRGHHQAAVRRATVRAALYTGAAAVTVAAWGYSRMKK